MQFFIQIEHLFKMFLDTGEIRIMSSAIDLVDVDTFLIYKTANNEDITSSRIYGAFAAGINVCLNSHKDNDFTYCAISVHMKREYTVDDKIVPYFASPKLNVAIPLRPGDIVFFDPLEEHCVSSRCENSDNVYVMLLYLKSNIIGKNDNSIPLTTKMDVLLQEYNKLSVK